MSAQVTEKHIDLVRCVLDAEWWGSNVEKKFAQLIADSEARACAELRAELDAQCLLNAKGAEREAVLLRRVDRMAKERDQLRAEIAQLQKNCTDIYDAGRKTEDQLRAEVEQWELAFQEQFARAERAEARKMSEATMGLLRQANLHREHIEKDLWRIARALEEKGPK